MSTEIAEIKGRYETYEKPSSECIYKECGLHLNRFYGGEENGRMLQLTINSNKDGYIQLTKEQVKSLAIILLDSFEDDIYPSE